MDQVWVVQVIDFYKEETWMSFKENPTDEQIENRFFELNKDCWFFRDDFEFCTQREKRIVKIC